MDGDDQESFALKPAIELSTFSSAHASVMCEEKGTHSDSEIILHHEKRSNQPKNVERPGLHKLRSSFSCTGLLGRIFDFIHIVMVKKSRQTTLSFIMGVIVGITLTAMLFQHNFLMKGHINKRNSPVLDGAIVPTSPPQNNPIRNNAISKPNLKSDSTVHDESFENLKNPPYMFQPIKNDIKTGAKVFVGVITAEKFLPTRALAVNATWGSQVDKVSFFAEKGTPEEYGIPVVNLDGISDKEYPPQKKAFLMLKYMCENYIDDYDWFMRSDDDVYIRVEKLKLLLAKIDSNKYIYMGQPGHGVPEVRDKLGLNGHNFCMGGPSVLFNKKAMKALCPHIDNCMSEVVSGEEDVEIGRCVSNHLHIECTHAWETLKLFYHSYQEEYTEEKPFLGNLAENVHVEKAITLHHVKVPYIMYKIHRHYMSLLLNSSTHSISCLRKQAESLNKVLPYGKHRELSGERVPPDPYKADKPDDVSVWNAFSVESLFLPSYINPSDDITNDHLADLKQIGETAIDIAIDHAASHLSYSHIAGGYYRSDYLRGTDYLLDVYFSSKEITKPDEVKRVHILRPLSDLKVTSIEKYVETDEDISIFVVLALKQTADTASDFEEYMRKYYEQATREISASRSGKVKTSLIIASYGGKNEETNDRRDAQSPSVDDVVKWFRVKHPQSIIEAIPGQGSDEKKGDISSDSSYFHDAPQAYTKGTLRAFKLWDGKSKGIILLTSTNFSLSQQLLKSCLYFSSLHSLLEDSELLSHPDGTQFYQPISFSLYSTMETFEGNNAFSDDMGYWLLNKENSKGNLNLPLCGSIDHFVSATNYMQYNPNNNIIQTLYESIYDFRNFLQRIPSKSLLTRRKR